MFDKKFNELTYEEKKELKEKLKNSVLISEIIELDKNNKLVDDPSVSYNPKTRLLKDFSGNHSLYGNNGKSQNVIQVYQKTYNLRYNEALKELSDRYLNTSFNQNIEYKPRKKYKPAPAPKETIIFTGKYSREEKQQVLKKYFELSTLTIAHRNKFIEKRDFEPTENYKSYSNLVIKELEKTFDSDLISSCGLNNPKLKDRILIFFANRNGQIEDYTAYSFTDKKKKLITSNEFNLKRIPFRIDLINQNTIHIVITEGEEKADSCNVLNIPNTVFISIGSINNHKPVLEYLEENKDICSNKTISILFDRKAKEVNVLNEENFSYILAKKIHSLNLGITINICLMPEIPNQKESDLTDYLKHISTIGKDKKQELLKILNKKLLYKDFENILIDMNKLKDTDYFKPKQEYSDIVTNITNKPIELEALQEKLYNDTLNFLTFEEKGTFLVKLPPATGKSHTMKKLAEKSGFRLAYITFTKELRDNVSTEIKDSKKYLSLMDRYLELIEKANIDKKAIETQKVYNGIIDLINLGYHDKIENYIKKSLKIDISIDKDYFKKMFYSIDTLVLTHSLFINQQKANIDYSKYFDGVVIDEDPTNLLQENKKITVGTINNFIKYIDTKKCLQIKEFLELFLEFIKTEKKPTNRTLLSWHFNDFLESKGKNTLDLKNNLKREQVHFNNKKINKEIFNNDIDLGSLPNKKELELLLIEFLSNDFNNTTSNKGFDDILEINILNKYNIEYGNKLKEKLIILDATADKEILKYYGVNVVKELIETVKADNLEIIQDFSHTFTTSSIKNKDGLINDNYLNLFNELVTNENTLFLTTKDIEELLINKIPCKLGHFNKHDKATNEFKDCETSIITMPKVNYKHIESIARLLKPDLNNFEYDLVEIPTGIIKDGKEYKNYEKRYTEDLINRLIYQKKHALIVQGLSRIRRDFTSKRQVIILGNVSLLEFGIIPNKVTNFLDDIKKGTHKKNLLINNISEKLQQKAYIFNSDLDSELLRYVTEDIKKQASNIDDNSVKDHFSTIEQVETIDTTMFTLNSNIDNNYGNSRKHCNSNSLKVRLSYNQQKTKDKIIKELSLEKSYIDLDNERKYFYYSKDSNLSKEEIKAIVRTDLNIFIQPATAPAEKTIIENISSEKLEAGFNIEVNNLEPITYENISSSVFDDMKLLQNSISEVRKNLYQGYSVEYLHKELDINFLEFMKANNFEYEFLSKDNLDLDCREYDYTAFISNKYLDSLDSSTIEKYNVDFTKIFTTVTNFLTAKEQLESTEHSNYDSFVKNNIVSLIASLEKYLNGLYFKSKILDDNYFIELDNYLEAPNLNINQTYKRVFIYETIIHSIHIINSDIAENNRLKEVKNTSGIKEIILKVLNFFKLSELIAV